MKRLISLAVSLVILALIYWKIDFPGLIKVFQNCNGWWMAISLGMVLPLTCITTRVSSSNLVYRELDKSKKRSMNDREKMDLTTEQDQ